MEKNYLCVRVERKIFHEKWTGPRVMSLTVGAETKLVEEFGYKYTKIQIGHDT